MEAEREESTLLALKNKEEAIIQEMQSPGEAEKGKQTDFLPETLEGIWCSSHFDFSPVKSI